MWIRLRIWLILLECEADMCHDYRVFRQKLFWKTKSRALQLHFGTNPSVRLQIVFENGTLEVEDYDFVLAQKWKCFECGGWSFGAAFR